MTPTPNDGTNEPRAKRYPNPKHELMCCMRCGRDTTNATGYCSACWGVGGRSERYGRKIINLGDATREDDYGEEATGNERR